MSTDEYPWTRLDAKLLPKNDFFEEFVEICYKVKDIMSTSKSDVTSNMDSWAVIHLAQLCPKIDANR